MSYSLQEVRRFAFDWLQPLLDDLAGNESDKRFAALNRITDSRWRWTVGVFEGLLPDPSSSLMTEYLLQALCAIDPRSGIREAQALTDREIAPHTEAGRIFLESLPPRLVGRLPPTPPLTAVVPNDATLPTFFDVLSHAANAVYFGLIPAATDYPTPEAFRADLTRKDLIIRFQIVAGMDASKDPRVLRMLVDHVMKPDERSPGIVLRCLHAINRRAAPTALDCAIKLCGDHGHFFRRQAAADFLAEVAPQRAIEVANSMSHPDIGARALARWQPDAALELFHDWLSRSDRTFRNAGTDVLFELICMELLAPTAATARRLDCCRDLSLAVLEDRDPCVRPSALANLAELGWTDWETRARDMLTDREAIPRFEAIGLLDDKGGSVECHEAVGLLSHPDRMVRERTLAIARRRAWDPKQVIAAIHRLDHSSGDAALGIEMLARFGHPEGYDLVRSWLRSFNTTDVRIAALAAGAVLAPARKTWLRLLARGLNAKDSGVRRKSLELLREHGSSSHIPQIRPRLQDKEDVVRAAAVRAVGTLASEQAVELVASTLIDPSDEVYTASFEILRQRCAPQELAAIALAKLPQAASAASAQLLDLLLDSAPERSDEAIEAAIASPSAAARMKGLTALRTVSPDRARSAAKKMLRDKHWPVRQASINLLADCDDPVLVDDLLPLARDADNDVREAAIRSLAKFNDPRVLGELISSLNDVSDNVRETAQEILSDPRSPVPSATRLADLYGPDFWRKVQDHVKRINRWASRVGEELLGRPVVVQNYRQGMGRTRQSRGSRPVTIEVADFPLTTGHPWGDEIMRGLALHEIGHHLYDIGIRGFKTVRGIARSEGIGDIYDVLLDERLERNLRARRSGWGKYLDRLASYAFAQDVHLVPLDSYAALVELDVDVARQRLGEGVLPGQYLPADAHGRPERVALREHEMLSMPGAVPVCTAFLACLRCGLDPRLHSDPRVAEAIGMVPANLKDLAHKDLLEAARRIAARLGGKGLFKKAREYLRQRLQQHRVALRGLRNALERMAAAGQLPGWPRDEAPDIRQTPSEASPQYRRPIHRLRGGKGLNLGPSSEFNRLEKQEWLSFDPPRHAQLVAKIRKHIRRMRTFFAHLAMRQTDEYGHRKGHRLDVARARTSLVKRELNVLVGAREEFLPDAYVGILIDRSGSMRGEKLELATAFGALVAESLRALPGLAGHVNAFDGDTFYRLGDFRRSAVASLTADDGNNDSGGLARAAELALASRKHNKLLVMISDGSPAECTFESLKNLVERLSHNHGIVCAQVAVEHLEEIAFPHYIDLSRCLLEEAVFRFGTMLMRLTRAWR